MLFGGGIGRRIDKVQEGLSPLIKNPYVRCKSLSEQSVKDNHVEWQTINKSNKQTKTKDHKKGENKLWQEQEW